MSVYKSWINAIIIVIVWLSDQNWCFLWQASDSCSSFSDTELMVNDSWLTLMQHLVSNNYIIIETACFININEHFRSLVDCCSWWGFVRTATASSTVIVTGRQGSHQESYCMWLKQVGICLMIEHTKSAHASTAWEITLLYTWFPRYREFRENQGIHKYLSWLEKSREFG